jgi:type VI secretion system secreted protein Hcp
MDLILFKPGDSIKGESQIDAHTDEIELLSFSHGMSMQVTSDQSNTERTSGKSMHQEFVIMKYLDAATPKLHEYCNKGDSIGQCTILIGRNDNGSVVPLITYTLDDAIISSISVSGGGGDKPVETLSLNYTKIKMEYKQQNSSTGQKGSNATTWDLKTNKAA